MFRVSILLVMLATLTAGELDPQIQELYKTMPRDQFIEYFNKLNLSFTITKHDMEPFVGGVIRSKKDGPGITHIAPLDLPDNFDSRKTWPHCVTITEIYDQQSPGCGSCWAFGAATTASDRTCIHKNITVRLSEQDLECCKNCYGDTVCNGGSPGDAFDFWINEGLVSQECKPYDVEALKKGGCSKKCVNGKDYSSEKHKGTKAYNLQRDDATIKTELFKNGPIEAGMAVYEDFYFHYSGGIYVHKFGVKLGGHSVRVIGFGVENGVEYWLGANSWGKKWGEKGFFKIKKFQSGIGFEYDMLGCMP